MSTVGLALMRRDNHISSLLLFLPLYPTILQVAKPENSIQVVQAQDVQAAQKVSSARASATLELQRSENSVWTHLRPSTAHSQQKSYCPRTGKAEEDLFIKGVVL